MVCTRHEGKEGAIEWLAVWIRYYGERLSAYSWLASGMGFVIALDVYY